MFHDTFMALCAKCWAGEVTTQQALHAADHSRLALTNPNSVAVLMLSQSKWLSAKHCPGHQQGNWLSYTWHLERVCLYWHACHRSASPGLDRQARDAA